jgi:cytochrome c-type biogenesis protein CcmH
MIKFRIPYVLLLSSIFVFVIPASYAVEENFAFDDEDKRALFIELGNELRCPKCQNQNVADSNAVVAKDMTLKVYELVQQGQSKAEIIDYMKQRYGDFVHYKPPVTAVTLWLWLLPLIFIVCGALFMFLLGKKNQVNVDHDQLKKANEWLNDK